jgi:glucose-6-phosphate isomerase
MKLRRNKLVPIALEASPGIESSEATYTQRIEQLEVLRVKALESAELATPLARCVNLPEQLLREYSELRTLSRLGEVFTWANRFQNQCDRVVFVASASNHRIISAFLEACCDPLWNELTRGERGSKPRIYFAGEAFDNDAFQGLLRVLSPQRPANRDEPYGTGLVVLSRVHAPSSIQVAKDRLVAELQKNSNPTSQDTLGPEPLVYDCLPNIQSDGLDSCDLPSAFLPFSAHGMLPAAILGINIMELLAGAAWTSRLFFSTAAHENPILQWVAWNHTLESRKLALWSRGLGAAAQWLGALSDWKVFHALAEPPCDPSLAICNHLWVEQSRFDSLSLDPALATDVIWDPGSDRPRSAPSGQSICTGYTEQAKTGFEQTLAHQAHIGGKGLTIRLPDLGELSVGQWMQWMIIAQLLEVALQDGALTQGT